MSFKPLAFIVAVSILLSGCSTLWHGANNERHRNHSSSSLVSFLYPDGHLPPEHDEKLPQLTLPLRVGIAFVPSHHNALSAATQESLLQRVREAFVDRPFVSDISVIPDIYLRSSSGLMGMQQVARMQEVDVMALVSYDQLTVSGERDSALLYWTIVGALVVKGNSNEVHTLIDTAVFDINSGRLLLRAPGSATAQQNSTLIDAARDGRQLQMAGFDSASQDMIVNLDTALQSFKERIQQGQAAEVSWQPGYSGGGSMGIALLALLLTMAWLQRSLNQRPNTR